MTTEIELEPASKRMNKKRNTLIFMFVLVVMVIAGIWYLFTSTAKQSTDDAYVAGQQVLVTSQEAGIVDSIYVDNTQIVKKGETLVILDENKNTVAQQAAEAHIMAVIRDVKSHYLKMEQLQAEIKAQEIALMQSKADYQRRIGGDKDGSVLPEVLAHAKNAVSMNEQTIVALNKELQAIKTLYPEEEVLLNPQVQAAISQLRQSYLVQENSKIVASRDGMIAKRAVQLGQQIQPGQPLMVIVPLEDVWVDANFKETQLAEMKVGQSVKVTADIYDDEVVYDGVVAGIDAGTGGAFSAIPAQNATGNWIKVIQRVPVRIYLDPKQVKAHPLRIGMSMNVTVNTASEGKTFDASLFTKDESLTEMTQQHLDAVDQRLNAFIQNKQK